MTTAMTKTRPLRRIATSTGVDARGERLCRARSVLFAAIHSMATRANNPENGVTTANDQ